MAVPKGLRLTDPFPEPIFTPSTKEDVGARPQHRSRRGRQPGRRRDAAPQAQALCLDLFSRAAAEAPRRRVSCSPTRSSNSGSSTGDSSICDEVITPDSSRIWPADEVRSGEVPPGLRQATVS